jgi:hypothetical protein
MESQPGSGRQAKPPSFRLHVIMFNGIVTLMENEQIPLADTTANLALLLPREAFKEIILMLCRALPAPESDDPADRVRRDRAAMAGVASLHPVNAAEGRLAAQFVAVDAWSMDCLRQAEACREEPGTVRRCLAQSVSLIREGKSSLRLLLRLQEARRAAAKDEAASDEAAWAEHAAIGMMAEALYPKRRLPDMPPIETYPPETCPAETHPSETFPEHAPPAVSCDAKSLPQTRAETQARFPEPAVTKHVQGAALAGLDEAVQGSDCPAGDSRRTGRGGEPGLKLR